MNAKVVLQTHIANHGWVEYQDIIDKGFSTKEPPFQFFGNKLRSAMILSNSKHSSDFSATLGHRIVTLELVMSHQRSLGEPVHQEFHILHHV